MSFTRGYFAYANSMNQQCNLPMGPIGSTGTHDGCPVWAFPIQLK